MNHLQSHLITCAFDKVFSLVNLNQPFEVVLNDAIRNLRTDTNHEIVMHDITLQKKVQTKNESRWP